MKTKLILAVLLLVGAPAIGAVLQRSPSAAVSPAIAKLEEEAEKFETLATVYFTYEVNPELNALLRGRAAAFREAIKIVRAAEEKAAKAPGPVVSRGR